MPWPGEGPAAPPVHRSRRRHGMSMASFQWLLPGALALGGLVGWWVKSLRVRSRLEKARSEGQEIVQRTVQEAEHQKRQALLQAREEWLKSKSRLEQDL